MVHGPWLRVRARGPGTHTEGMALGLESTKNIDWSRAVHFLKDFLLELVRTDWKQRPDIISETMERMIEDVGVDSTTLQLENMIPKL